MKANCWFGKHDIRRRLVLEGSRAFGVSYVYANLVGNEAGRAIYDGDALIATLAEFNIRGERREDRVGVWVRRPDKGETAEDKIAAIGIRVRRWVTFHGISLNVEPDLSHFSGIVPCGVRQHGVTSLVDLGIPVTMPEADAVLRGAFEQVFGPTVTA